MDIWKYIADKHFPIVQDQQVLEIGAFDGKFSELILSHSPNKLWLLEFDNNWYTQLCKKFDSTKVTTLHGDMHKDLSKIGPVDVVIALGVIYHSHAPLYLLEEIVNVCTPKVLIIDAPGSEPGEVIKINYEPHNDLGMRIVDKDRACCNFIINLGQETIIQAMKNIGYRLEYFEILPTQGQIKVSNVPFFKFIKT